MNQKTQKHFTLEERSTLLDCIIKHYSIRKTAEILKKSPSSVSRELKKHRYLVKGFEASKCKHVRVCRKGPHCHINCNNFTEDSCIKLQCAPWICNGCENIKYCRKNKYRYDPLRSHKQYTSTLSKARSGVRLQADSINTLNSILTPRIREQGQSLYHIAHSDDVQLPVSLSTIYRMIDDNLLNVRNIDLPRRIRYRNRKKGTTTTKETKPRENRTYNDFLSFIEAYPNASLYEMDTVIGQRDGKHKVLLTLLLRESNFMFAFLLTSKVATEVVSVFDEMERKVGCSRFTTLFFGGLTDNGSEFAYANDLEKVSRPFKRTNIFYCDAMQSQQKGKIEKNHEYIRLYVPQGSSFDAFSQADITVMMNHINSVKRPQFDDKSPFEMLPRHLAHTVALLGYKQIPDKDVCLNMSLFKK